VSKIAAKSLQIKWLPLTAYKMSPALYPMIAYTLSTPYELPFSHNTSVIDDDGWTDRQRTTTYRSLPYAWPLLRPKYNSTIGYKIIIRVGLSD